MIVALFSSVCATDHVLPYSASGPQAAAHNLIGVEWWQWDIHGDIRPREYPIKVVIYWNQTLDQTKKRFPINRERELDFRYVSYPSAIQYLEEKIKEFQGLGLDSSPMQQTLNRIRKAHQ